MPTFSLKKNQLKERKEEIGVSYHGVKPRQFKDKNGKDVKGYFKPCHPSKYPPLLAKYVVAFSVRLRLALGEKVSEEWLVYDHRNEVVGTFSFKIPDFTPFEKYSFSDLLRFFMKKSDELELEGFIKAVIALLISSYIHGNFDLHPENWGLKGIIDLDEFFFRLTSKLKEKKLIAFIMTIDFFNYISADDIRNFPFIKSFRLHWAGYVWPKNFHILKAYKTNAFLHLKDHPKFNTLKFMSILKELLAYNKDILEKRMENYLAGEKLDLQSLLPEKREAILAYGNPRHLFYDSDKSELSFIRHCTLFFEQEQQEINRIVISMPEFRDFLIYVNRFSDPLCELREWFVSYNVDQIVPYDMTYINQQYHQCWQDSFALLFKSDFDACETTLCAIKKDHVYQKIINQSEPPFSKDIPLLLSQVATDLESEKRISFRGDEKKWIKNSFYMQSIKLATDALSDLVFYKSIYFKKNECSLKANGEFIQMMKEIMKKYEAQKLDLKKMLEDASKQFDLFTDGSVLMRDTTRRVMLVFEEMDARFHHVSDSLSLFHMNYDLLSAVLEKKASDESKVEPQSLLSFSFPSKKTSPAFEPLVPLAASSPVKEKKTRNLEQLDPIIKNVGQSMKYWITTVDPLEIRQLVRTARLNEYDPGRSIFAWTRTRRAEVDTMPLHEIFQKGEWNSSSLNTSIIKNLCLKMVNEKEALYQSMDSDLQLAFSEVVAKKQDYLWWGKVAKRVAEESGLIKVCYGLSP